MRRLSAILSMTMLMGAAAAHAETAASRALAGTWTARSAEQDGAPAAALAGHRLLLDGDAYAITAPGGKLLYSGTYKVDTSVQPPHIDFVGTAAGGGDASWEGIYQLQGNRLTIVDDAPDPAKGRPTALAALAGSGHVLVVFERSP